MIYERLAAAGLPVEDHRVPGYKNLTFRPQYACIHHTAGTNSLRLCKYGRSDLPGPLCQILVPKSGVLQVITDGYANHAGRVIEPYSNYSLVGIEIENLGNGSDPYTPAQLANAAAACNALGLSVVVGHKEICVPTGRKIDPSFDMDAFRASLAPEEPEVLTDRQNDLLERLAAAVLNDDNPDAGMAWSVAHIRNDFIGPRFNVPNALTSLSERIAALEARPTGDMPTAAEIASALIDQLRSGGGQ